LSKENESKQPAQATSELKGMVRPCDMPCPKCGSMDVFRKFWAKNDREEARCHNLPKSKWIKTDEYWNTAIKDHIVHHCRCCQYDWETLPMAHGAA
jgi:hypothetical protein